jgi:hypothetical protein
LGVPVDVDGRDLGRYSIKSKVTRRRVNIFPRGVFDR